MFGRHSDGPVCGLATLLFVLGCGPAHRELPIACVPATRRPSNGGLTPKAAAAFSNIKEKYGSCHTYRDRGTVLSTRWESDTSSFLVIGRFDTVFHRDRGLRFRYFDEGGALRYAIWAHEGQIQRWYWGAVQSPGSNSSPIMGAMGDLRGVTSLTSWIVPAMLYRQLPVPNVCGPFEVDSYECPKCTRVAFGCSPQGEVSEFSMDLGSDLIRRFYWKRVLSSHPPSLEADSPLVGRLPISGAEEPAHADDAAKLETLILYDSPELDVDEAAILPDLEKRPW